MEPTGYAFAHLDSLACDLFVHQHYMVFFRADSLEDATRILYGMIDIGSINSVSVDDIPTSNLSWGGHFSDRLIENMPLGLAANLIPLIMIAIAFLIIAQK